MTHSLHASQPKAAIILNWCGPWRPWIHLFLESCGRNPGYDFLIFSGSPPPNTKHANVTFYPMSMAEFSSRAQTKLELQAEVASPYKLCDFRPTYGLIFDRELEGYDWWGYCDEDVVWGNLNHFLTEDIYASHDIVTSCRTSIVGQLTLFRNEDKTNRLFQRVPGWKECLIDSDPQFLDEVRLNAQALKEESQGQLRVWRHQIQSSDLACQQWWCLADHHERVKTGRSYPRFLSGNAIWRDGKVFDEQSNTEVAFFHFMTWKRNWPNVLVPKEMAEAVEWQISQSGINFKLPTNPPSELAVIYRRYQSRCKN